MITTLVVLILVGLGTLLTLALVVGLAALTVGVVLSLGFFLAFKVLPVILIGYLVIRFLRPRHRRLESGRWDYDRLEA
jgi:hypothetical protein